MIKVIIKKDQIIVDGHANYDEKGKDIVCASISTLVISSINLMLSFDDKSIKYEDNDGYIKIDIKKHSTQIDKIIDNMISMLKELEKDYKKNIKIYKEV